MIAALGIACWLSLAVATGRRWRRARLASTIVFGLAFVASLSMAYVPMPGYLAAAQWLPLAAGLVAIVVLGMPAANARR
ncbi:MAG: hypothetical protein L0K86_07325 [Actinomycetia bacterium]|nr:hypothetical protein [Actinomycetes bacterium]